MNNSFMTAPHFVFTSESVTEGHPDKICDQVSDAILDALIVDDPDARVAVETATTTGLVMVIGEVTTSTYADIPTIIRNTVRDIGYTHADYGFDHQTCSVITSIHEQSADIALGVDKARLSTISYGKERPLCTESDESCWSQNRRGVSAINQ